MGVSMSVSMTVYGCEYDYLYECMGVSMSVGVVHYSISCFSA